MKTKNKEWNHVKGKQFTGKVFGGKNLRKIFFFCLLCLLLFVVV